MQFIERSWCSLSERLRDLFDRLIHREAKLAADANHFIRACGSSADSKHSIALFKQANRNRMKDLIEDGIA